MPIEWLVFVPLSFLAMVYIIARLSSVTTRFDAMVDLDDEEVELVEEEDDNKIVRGMD